MNTGYSKILIDSVFRYTYGGGDDTYIGGGGGGIMIETVRTFVNKIKDFKTLQHFHVLRCVLCIDIIHLKGVESRTLNKSLT